MSAVGTVLVVLLLAGCTGTGHDAARALPADRATALVYAALGDSTVEGVGASSAPTNYVSRLHDRLRQVYPGATVTNLGVAGATSADLLATQVDQAVGLHPHLITVSIGPNDITGRVVPEAFDRNVDAIFRRLAGETEALVVANLLPDLAVTPRFRGGPHAEAVGQLTRRFNEILAERGRRHGVVLVDLYGPSQREVPARPELVAADGYHPSDAGYARWAELVWAGVARRIAGR